MRDNNIYDFSSDKIYIFALVIDSSGSMSEHSNDVIQGLEMYRKSFENFPEANSIAVSISQFDDEFHPGDFCRIGDFSSEYYTGGGTALHYSIVKGGEHLIEYNKKVTEKTGCIPISTLIIFSDGEPCGDSMSESDSMRMLSKLNAAGINTVFVAFGKAIRSEFGKKLGFMCTIDVDNEERLTNFLGVELSKSCKEQSKSMKSLGSNFFSSAVGNSEGYSQATTQALEDNDWFTDIDDI